MLLYTHAITMYQKGAAVVVKGLAEPLLVTIGFGAHIQIP